YAAGDCTGVLPLASVAAMQGRIAIWHAMGEAVAPLRLRTVAANVFTDPELATVGVPQNDVDAARVQARQVMLPLSGNARAKMAAGSRGSRCGVPWECGNTGSPVPGVSAQGRR